MSAHDLIVMMGLVLAASVGTQLLAEHLRVPAILPLLGVGVLFGPELLGLVRPDALGVGLQVLIPLMVAIIVFEGGMVLDLGYLRQVSPIVRNLITVGCLVTWLLAALAANLLVGLPWPLALLFGALVSVTGPTVINPLLRRTAVTQRLKTILMAEGVLIDAVGVVLSVVVLEALLSGVSLADGALTWLTRVGGGTLLGIACGWLLGRGLRAVGRRYNAELTRLTALGGALAIYTLGELLSAEMGIAAAAAAGKDVREVTLKNPTLAGRALKDVRLDGDVLIVMIRRDKQLFVPHGNTTLALTDQLTLLGAAEDVATVSELFERHSAGGRLRDVPFSSGPRSEEVS